MPSRQLDPHVPRTGLHSGQQGMAPKRKDREKEKEKEEAKGRKRRKERLLQQETSGSLMGETKPRQWGAPSLMRAAQPALKCS